MSGKVIRRENIRRLIRDVKDVLQHPLEDNGIYYKHDESDMLAGYALIVGPPETPYEDGFFLFSLRYPPEYPYLPPTVTYCTNAHNIRFHPNLYRRGKVCLSLLNTWEGEQWTSCETIRSVLLALCGLFDAQPLLNEPGITADDPEVPIYNQIVEYGTYQTAMVEILQKKEGVYYPFFDLFYPEMETHFRRHRASILERVAERYHESLVKNQTRTVPVETLVYGLSVRMDYVSLFQDLERI